MQSWADYIIATHESSFRKRHGMNGRQSWEGGTMVRWPGYTMVICTKSSERRHHKKGAQFLCIGRVTKTRRCVSLGDCADGSASATDADVPFNPLVVLDARHGSVPR